jgi:hypothetical protein
MKYIWIWIWICCLRSNKPWHEIKRGKKTPGKKIRNESYYNQHKNTKCTSWIGNATWITVYLVITVGGLSPTRIAHRDCAHGMNGNTTHHYSHIIILRVQLIIKVKVRLIIILKVQLIIILRVQLIIKVKVRLIIIVKVRLIIILRVQLIIIAKVQFIIVVT